MAAPGEVEGQHLPPGAVGACGGMHLVIATSVRRWTSSPVLSRRTSLPVSPLQFPLRLTRAPSSIPAVQKKLLGRGDMLFSPHRFLQNRPAFRVAFVTDGEVERIIEFIAASGQKMTYDEQILQEIDRHAVSGQQEEGWQGRGRRILGRGRCCPARLRLWWKPGRHPPPCCKEG